MNSDQIHRLAVRRCLHRRHARQPEKMAEFRERTRGIEKAYQVQKVAKEMFPLIGKGKEASVYKISEDRVLKVSGYETNLRGEYIAFIDPEYAEITPDAYDHDDNWTWITIEKVEPLGEGNWKPVFDYLPRLQRSCENHDTYPGYQLPRIIRLFMENDGLPTGMDDASRQEKRFFVQAANLMEDLGVSPDGVVDIRPENLGFDQEGNLVIIDLYLMSDLPQGPI